MHHYGGGSDGVHAFGGAGIGLQIGFRDGGGSISKHGGELHTCSLLLVTILA